MPVYACEKTSIDADSQVGAHKSDALKPGISLPSLLALALWATCAIAYTLFENIGVSTIIACLVASIVGGVSSCVVLIFVPRLRFISIFFLGVSLGLVIASYGAINVITASQLSAYGADQWTFELLEDADKSDYGSKATAKATDSSGECVRVQIFFNNEVDYLCGDIIHANATLAEPSESSKTYYYGKGISAVVRLKNYDYDSSNVFSYLSVIRRQAIQLMGDYGGEQAGILQALACGYRNTIEQSGSYDNYKTLGLAHIVAVSGAHLVIVISTLQWLLSLFRLPRSVSLVLCGIFAFIYMIFAGIPISAVRAAFMVMLSLIASGVHRRAVSLNALSLCIITFLVIDPTTSVSVSFFLSAASTMGILLFAGLISDWFSALPKRVKKIVADPAALTLSSNIVTQPFSAALFSQLPLLSLPANLIAAPLFTLGCIAGLVCAVLSCIFSGIASVIVQCAVILVYPLDFTVNHLAGIPYACIAVDVPVVPMVVFTCVISLALWLSWPKISMRLMGVIGGGLVVILAVVILVSPYLRGDEIIMLNVGQGDAFVVRSKGATILIDTGNQDSMLRQALGREGVYSLDAVIVSHSDDDHYGSLTTLNDLVNIGEIYLAQDALSCDCSSCESLREAARQTLPDKNIEGLSVGDILQVGDFTLEVVWPQNFTEEGENADSLCLLTAVDCDTDGQTDWTTFFCGDAEQEQLQTLEDSGKLSSVDVLKVGHHGSKASLSDELCEELNPSIALISVGENNSYGHPSEEALDHLQKVDTEIFRSDEQGDVKLTFSVDAITVS